MLRRARGQRQRGQGARRADLDQDRAGAGRDRLEERDDRLDGSGERPRLASGHREAHPAQAWLPARQAGEGDTDRA